jgi:hypothetical protein
MLGLKRRSRVLRFEDIPFQKREIFKGSIRSAKEEIGF